eukprot:m51a1_g715 hypothetical protein (926) ;mRNA; f:423011-425949
MRTAQYILASFLLAVAAGAGGAVPYGTRSVASRAGWACLFEGEGTEQLAVGPPIASNASISELTMSLWLRTTVPANNLYAILGYVSPDNTQSWAKLGSQDPAFTFFLDSDSYSAFARQENGKFKTNHTNWTHLGPAVSTDWVHLTATWASADGLSSFYINGKFVIASAGSAASSKGLVLPGGGHFVFPQENWGAKFFGAADEIAAWSARLSAEEVARVYAGDYAVRADRVIAHWSCDRVGDPLYDEATGRSGTSTGPAVLQVPSTVPDVNKNLSAVTVAAAGATTLRFPVPVTVTALPSNGSLSVAVGAAPVTEMRFTPPAGWRDGDVVSFATSYARVQVRANRAPSAKVDRVEVPEGTKIVISLAYWDIASSRPALLRKFLYNVDQDGDQITARVRVLPQLGYGQLLQYDGSALSDDVNNDSSLITDPNYRVVFYALPGSLGKTISIGADISDGIQKAEITRQFTITASDIPAQPRSKSVTLAQDASGIDIALELDLDPYNQNVIVLTGEPKFGKLFNPDGTPVTMVPTVHKVLQWADKVLDYGEQYPGYPATNVLGAPEAFPDQGDTSYAWATYTGFAWHFLTVQFERVVQADSVEVYEVYYPDSVYRIDLFDEVNQLWVTVFDRPTRNYTWKSVYPLAPDPGAAVPNPKPFAPELFTGLYQLYTRTVKIYVHTPTEDEWPEIDAISLVGYESTDAAVLKGRTVHYVPNRDTFGTDTFEFEGDSNGKTAMSVMSRLKWFESPVPGTVTVVVERRNRVPKAVSETLVVAFGEDVEEVAIQLSAVDEDENDTLTYTIVDAPKLGKLHTARYKLDEPAMASGSTSSSAKLYYYYNCKDPGVEDDTLTFFASDGQSKSDTATVNLQVFCAHDKGYDKKTTNKVVAALVVTDVVFVAAIVTLGIALFLAKRDRGHRQMREDVALKSSP